MLAWLAMATELVVAVPPPREAPRPVWYAVSSDASGDELIVVGQAGYDARPVSVSVAVSYRSVRDYGREASVSALAGGPIDRGMRLELQVWRDVGRRGGGLGLTLRRTLGP